MRSFTCVCIHIYSSIKTKYEYNQDLKICEKNEGMDSDRGTDLHDELTALQITVIINNKNQIFLDTLEKLFDTIIEEVKNS